MVSDEGLGCSAVYETCTYGAMGGVRGLPSLYPINAIEGETEPNSLQFFFHNAEAAYHIEAGTFIDPLRMIAVSCEQG